MLRGSLLCAIALIGLVSLVQGEPDGKSVSNDQPEMSEIRVEFCTHEEIEIRKSHCETITDPSQKLICQSLFEQLVALCKDHLSEVIEKTFDRELLQDLWREYDTIEDQVGRPVTKKLRANLEEYFDSDDIFWDDEYCGCDPDEILKSCHQFVVDYQTIGSILKYNGKKPLFLIRDEKPREIFQIFEFCRAFSKHYDTKNEVSELYSDGKFVLNDQPEMPEIRVEFCTHEDIEDLKSHCETITDPSQKLICQSLFEQLVALCKNHLSKVIEKTFDAKLLKDLWREYDTIEDQVGRPVTKALRANLEEYFDSDDIFWDDYYCDCDPDETVEFCHRFVVDYRTIRSILKYQDEKSLFSIGGRKPREIFQIFEFCRAFSNHYDTKNEDSELYSDI